MKFQTKMVRVMVSKDVISVYLLSIKILFANNKKQLSTD